MASLLLAALSGVLSAGAAAVLPDDVDEDTGSSASDLLDTDGGLLLALSLAGVLELLVPEVPAGTPCEAWALGESEALPFGWLTVACGRAFSELAGALFSAAKAGAAQRASTHTSKANQPTTPLIRTRCTLTYLPASSC